MILAITSTAGPEARKAEYPTSRLRTGSPQLEYRNDLGLVLTARGIQHSLHEAFADYRTMCNGYRTFGREEPISRSADLGVFLARYISKKDVGRHERCSCQLWLWAMEADEKDSPVRHSSSTFADPSLALQNRITASRSIQATCLIVILHRLCSSSDPDDWPGFWTIPSVLTATLNVWELSDRQLFFSEADSWVLTSVERKLDRCIGILPTVESRC